MRSAFFGRAERAAYGYRIQYSTKTLRNGKTEL